MPAFFRRQFVGGAVPTVTTSSLGVSDTSVTLSATTGWPTGAEPFYVVISAGSSAEEKCLATISGSTLTLTRGQDDTSAQTHASGASIYPVFTADDADEANEVAAKLTTKGDLLVTTGSVLNRLAVGTNDHVLTADTAATNGVKWAAIPAAVSPNTVDAKGDLLVGTADNTVGKLTAGTNEHRLVADSATTEGLKYVADTTNYAVAAKGDLLAGTAADTLAAVTVGADGQVLTADSNATSGVAWAYGGLTLIKSQTIGTTVSSVTVSDVFSADYENYRIVVSVGSASTVLNLLMTLGATTTGYYRATQGVSYAGAGSASGTANGASWFIISTSSDGAHGSLDVFKPFAADQTGFVCGTPMNVTNGSVYFGGGYLDNTTSYTAFTLATSTGTITGGEIRVYGYRN